MALGVLMITVKAPGCLWPNKQVGRVINEWRYEWSDTLISMVTQQVGEQYWREIIITKGFLAMTIRRC